ncbi:MAG TPA: histidine phosphatase family protein [Gemmataceae bacterium]|nr:histidine phosphatase family protein [Gemmataceae bacterium]
MNALSRVSRFTTLAAVLAVVAACLSGIKALSESPARTNTKYPQHILIIRHAEKTGDKADVHLSKQGKERAEVLDQLFAVSKARPHSFPRPDFIFAASHQKDSQRPLETVTLLARKLKLSINNEYNSKKPPASSTTKDKKKAAKKKRMQELRDEIFGSPKYFGKTILVAWRHSTIPELAKTLGASKVPAKWDDKVFDRVWQITYADDGKAIFRDLPQRLLPGDAEK